MRPIVLLLFLAACSTPEEATGIYGHHVEIEGSPVESGPVTWQSQYAAALAGVYFPSGLDWAVAGMEGQTCQLQYSMGAVEADDDLGEGDDTVFDGTPNDHGTDTVAVFDGSDTLTFADFPSGQVLWSRPAPGAVAARFTEDGMVLLAEADGCSLEWQMGAASATFDVGASCAEGAALEVAPDGSQAWVAADGELWSATPDGALRLLSDSADLFALDGATGTLYTGSSGVVRALGASPWEVDVGGTIMGLDDLGPIEAVIASVHSARGDRLVVLDGATGELILDQPLLRPAAGIVAAEDGRAIAMIGDWRTDFFAVGSLDPRP